MVWHGGVGQVQVNKLMIAGRMERLWLLSLKWFMDRDLYQIEAVREVGRPVCQ